MRVLRIVVAHARTTIGNVNQMIMKTVRALCHLRSLLPLSKDLPCMSYLATGRWSSACCLCVIVYQRLCFSYTDRRTGRSWWPSAEFRRNRPGSLSQKMWTRHCLSLHHIRTILYGPRRSQNNVLYDIGTNWSHVDKLQMPANDDTFL